MGSPSTDWSVTELSTEVGPVNPCVDGASSFALVITISELLLFVVAVVEVVASVSTIPRSVDGTGLELTDWAISVENIGLVSSVADDSVDVSRASREEADSVVLDDVEALLGSVFNSNESELLKVLSKECGLVVSVTVEGISVPCSVNDDTVIALGQVAFGLTCVGPSDVVVITSC